MLQFRCIFCSKYYKRPSKAYADAKHWNAIFKDSLLGLDNWVRCVCLGLLLLIICLGCVRRCNKLLSTCRCSTQPKANCYCVKHIWMLCVHLFMLFESFRDWSKCKNLFLVLRGPAHMHRLAMKIHSSATKFDIANTNTYALKRTQLLHLAFSGFAFGRSARLSIARKRITHIWWLCQVFCLKYPFMTSYH